MLTKAERRAPVPRLPWARWTSSPIVPEVLRSKVSVFVELARTSAKLKERPGAAQQQECCAAIPHSAGVAPDAMVMP